jgi:hypothetical protein
MRKFRAGSTRTSARRSGPQAPADGPGQYHTRQPQRPSAQEAFLLLSAQRFFIASDSRFLPAGVSGPRLFGTAALGDKPFARRFAQRRFIASDKRRRPSGVMLPFLLRAAFRVRPLPPTPAPSSNVAIARPIFSLSRFNSAMILSRSNFVLLDQAVVTVCCHREGTSTASSVATRLNISDCAS